MVKFLRGQLVHCFSWAKGLATKAFEQMLVAKLLWLIGLVGVSLGGFFGLSGSDASSPREQTDSFAAATAAQHFRGKVTDLVGAPIPGALVEADGVEPAAVASSGYFDLVAPISVDPVRYTIHAEGYRDVTGYFTVGDKADPALEIRLEANP